MSKNNLAPVVLFCYNRLDCLKETIEALRKNELASESDLFIYSDGPKPGDDSAAVYGVREYLKTISGFKSIHITEAKTNKGLANSIIAGVTEIVNRFGKIIVLEDDLVTSPYFIRFMNDALDMYENDDRVAGIHGWSPTGEGPKPELFFIREVGCWGWATWQRAWKIFEIDGKKLLDRIKTKKEKRIFDHFGTYPYLRMLKNQIKGKVDSWAIRWYASVFVNDKLGLQSGINLIQHIGINGTHFDDKNRLPADEISKIKPVVKKIPVEFSSSVLRSVYCRYNNAVFGGYAERIKNRLKDLIRLCLPLGMIICYRRLIEKINKGKAEP